jgi:hypothetical protein
MKPNEAELTTEDTESTENTIRKAEPLRESNREGTIE